MFNPDTLTHPEVPFPKVLLFDVTLGYSPLYALASPGWMWKKETNSERSQRVRIVAERGRGQKGMVRGRLMARRNTDPG